MTFVQQFAGGPQVEISQKILNELSQARVCLLNPELKAQYDVELRRSLEEKANPEPTVPAIAPLRTGSAKNKTGRTSSKYIRRKKSGMPLLIGGLVSAGIVVAAVSWILNRGGDVAKSGVRKVKYI